MNQADIDRLTIRQKPTGKPVMYQVWLRLLFMHWPMRKELLRPHVPAQLEIDSFNGTAWIGITPFSARARPAYMPRLPWIGSFHEINLRTYVHYQGVPGIWFFSLDADSILAVIGARMTYHLPYRHAHIRMEDNNREICYTSKRSSHPRAEFNGVWRWGEVVGQAALGSLEFFLAERYCLYTVHRGQLFRARVFHDPWTIQQAELLDLETTMLKAHGLEVETTKPLLHYSAEQHVAVWPLEKAGRA